MLGAPLQLPCGAVLPNRIAKAAMSEVLAEPSGAPGERLYRLYRRWAASGAGLLITGNVAVEARGMGERGNVVITDDRHLDALKRWAAAGQTHGARMWIQLNHAGRQAPRTVTRAPVAPSAIALTGMRQMFAAPRALTGGEIEAIVERFAIAAGIARAAGFDGVQLHGAHGYLISQFLSPRTNQRDDAWGGDVTRRMRFALEVVRAVRASVGASFPIGVKLNSADFQRGGFTIDEAKQVARALEAAGVDLLEVSGGNYESPAMTGSGELPAEQRASSQAREAYFLDYAVQIREATRMPIMLTGGMRSRAVMERALAGGAVDVIGLARPMTHAPELPRELLAGTRDAAPVVKLRSRWRRVDDALQVLWFRAQIHRMADGHDPAPELARWRALWHGVQTSGIGRGTAEVR